MKSSFNMLVNRLALAAVAASAFASVHAAEIKVTPDSTLWVNPPTENRQGGAATITGAAPYMGNGSLELTGERSRMVMGSLYATTTSLGLLDQLTRLTFDWSIAGNSVATLNPDYTPALRVSVLDGTTRTELIWEGVYNNTYGNTERDTWYSSGVNDMFYRYDASIGGVTKSGSSQVNMSLANWRDSAYFSNSAYIIGFSVGAGGSAGTGYHAFADNVTIGLNGTTNNYNFELASADVPEPASLGLLGLGLLGVAAARRRRTR